MKREELLLVHINDLLPVPVEIAEDKDRTIPGEGCLPLRKILCLIAELDYEGYYSLELFNGEIWDAEPEPAAAMAFRKTSAFLEGLKDG